MEDDPKKPPAAQDSPDGSQSTPPSAETPAAPEGAEGESSPAAGKKQRDLLADRGRQLKAAEARAQAAEAQTVQLGAQVNDLTARLQALEGHANERRQAEMEAELANLPPSERAERRVEMLEKRLENLTRPAPVDGKEIYRRESARLLKLANDTYGLTGTELEISPTDLPNSAHQTPEAFTAALEIIGQARSGKPGARSTESEDDDMPNAKSETPEEMEERITNSVLQKIGAGRSNAPRAAAGTKTEAPTEEDFVDTTFGYNSKKGPGAMRAELQKQRDRAVEAANARK